MVTITHILMLIEFLAGSRLVGWVDVHFAEDIYGHDARLDRALAAGGLPP